MLMTGKSIVRFRYPEWTLWALPFVVHEVWHIALAAKFNVSLNNEIEFASRSEVNVQLCLADAFATYTIGPAYAYAAITLLLDPGRPEDEARVSAILSVLRANEAPDDGGGATETYPMIASELRQAWDAAKRQAGASFPPITEEDADLLSSLLKDEVRGKRSRSFSTVMDELRKKWYAEGRRGGTSFEPTPAADDSIRRLVSSLCNALRRKGYPSFAIDQWHPLLDWRDRYHQLNWAAAPQLPDDADLRHLLNAAWLARVDPRRPIERDITDSTMQLAQEINRRAKAEPVITGWPPPGTSP